MIAGGSEAAITPLGTGGFCSMRALSTRNDEPHRASRPFDAERDGFVMGEGAGILVLEELETARRAGRKIYCEIVGYGMSGDAYHISAPCETGDGATRVMKKALKDAGVEPSEVDYVNVHGTSTPQGRQGRGHRHQERLRRPRPEARHQLHQVHDRAPAGRGGRARGRDHRLDPARPGHRPHHQLREPRPRLRPRLRAQRQARKADVRYVLSNSFGFGGTNGALLFKRWEE